MEASAFGEVWSRGLWLEDQKGCGCVWGGGLEEILKEAGWCWENLAFKVGKGNKIRQLAPGVEGFRITWEEDSIFWKGGGSGQFRVKEAYSLLDRPLEVVFPKNKIWVERVPTKIMFFAWEATWGKILTLDRLQKRGWQLPNCRFLCACEEENANHILIHCYSGQSAVGLVLGLVGVQWVFPKTVKEVLYSWGMLLWGKKGKSFGIPFRYLFFGRFGRKGTD
ncbi:hypothetical protein CK203_021805 [Vitis vinifera]|uniref:Reverse transcriptase zinc-binding domain-containing protein n=1 Tax=Vitis vinifera TaxID=29760 RepID=A0A438JFQ4_VITVI|nr:hypothetical protein CK203_021805 [Vitis vinifera]